MPEKRSLPRLDRDQYKGTARVHWIINIEDRQTGWLGEAFHREFERISLHTMARYRIACPVYCLMPDHMHLVWTGFNSNSGNQIVAMEFLRKLLRSILEPRFRFQRQAYDHVLRQHEWEGVEFENVCWYILENPVRKDLVENTSGWPYTGAIIPGYPDLDPHAEGYWELFWRIFAKLSNAP